MTALGALNATKPDLADILAAIDGVLAGQPRPVALHEPEIGRREREMVAECLSSGWVSYAGAHVRQFETAVAAFTGCRHGVALVNGTAALHACLLVEGIGAGDEVLVPSLTFVATANAVCHAGAVPHFVDVEPETFGIDPDALERHLKSVVVEREGRAVNRETGRALRALIAVHVFGHTARMNELLRVAEEFGLVVIEDATESIGSSRNGRNAGTFGRQSVLSFNGNKTITTGGGGMILTDDEDLARRIKHLTTTAKQPHKWAFDHDLVGYNYRLPALNAALGCAQMERLPSLLERKRVLAGRYQAAFRSIDAAAFVAERPDMHSNYWLNAIVLQPRLADQRDALLAVLHEAGVLARPVWTPMHKLAMFENCPRAPLRVSEDLVRRTVNLPSSACLAGRAADG